MDLWSVIPIGVHHYTILSTMVSFIPLGNILWKDTTCKHLLGNESYLMISFHHSILQLAYTTQAWILKFKTCAKQANIWNVHSKCNIQVYELAPHTCVLKIFWSPYFVIFLSPYIANIFVFLPISISLLFSPIVINDHKRWAQIMGMLGWNHVKWGSFSQFGSI